MLTEREQEIEKALNEAMPGPWEWERTGAFSGCVTAGQFEIVADTGFENAHLIANAPEWLRYCLSTIERLRKNLSVSNELLSKAQSEKSCLEHERNAQEQKPTDERVMIATAYWLDASPHERTEEDGLILAQFARYAMAKISGLQDSLKYAEDGVIHLNELVEQLREERDSWRRVSERLEREKVQTEQERDALRAALDKAQVLLDKYETMMD